MLRPTPPSAMVVVPVKSLNHAKARLGSVLDRDARAALARAMADAVLAAAAPLPVTVVCDDEEVARWARQRGADVTWTPGTDLNGALTEAVAAAADTGVRRVVIAHADLPFAHDLARFAEVDPGEVVVVTDRHGTGTNVLSLPTGTAMELHFGPGSAAAHRTAARRAGLGLREVRDEALAWDVDEPEDLHPPGSLGALPYPVHVDGGRKGHER